MKNSIRIILLTIILFAFSALVRSIKLYTIKNAFGKITLQEIKTTTLNSNKGPISAITFRNDNINLVYYDIGNGNLIQWDMNLNKYITNLLPIFSEKGLSFNPTGEYVIAATQMENRENDFGEETQYIGGIKIWETNTGELINCIYRPCDGSNKTSITTNFRISDDGEKLIRYGAISIDISNVSGEGVSKIITMSESFFREIADIEFFPNKKDKYLVSYREGDFSIEDNVLGFLPISIKFGEMKNDLVISNEIEISGNSNWMTNIIESEIFIWELSDRKGGPKYIKTLPYAKHALFSDDSKVLLVMGKDALLLWAFQSGYSVEYEAEGITSFTISNDGSLIAWGDKNGNVHLISLVWGRE